MTRAVPTRRAPVDRSARHRHPPGRARR